MNVNEKVDSTLWGKIDPSLLNCMPDFFVIAPPRCGSTWLFENLRQHPEIFIPPVKEVKYFSNYWNMCDINWYLSCFKEGSDKIKGDVSPSYAILPDQTIQAVKSIAPNLRIIFIFRDPIERIWSHVKHQFRLKESVFSFFDFEDISNVPEEKLIEALASTLTIAYSDYLSIVKRWMASYPKKNIYINFFDSITSSPQLLLEDVFQHIGVSKDVDWSRFPLHERINPGIEKKGPKRFNDFLLSFYSKKIKEFADFLSDSFELKTPKSWKYIANKDKNRKEIEPYKLYFSNNNNQHILKDILWKESVQSTHVQSLKEDHNGFRIVAFMGECLGISWLLDGIDISRTSKSDLEKFKREGKILCGETLNELISLIDTKAYDAIKSENEALHDESAARSSRIKALQDESAARSSRIKALQDESAARSSRIKELQDELPERDTRIKALQGESAAKGSRIEKLQDELASRDSGIEKIQSESIAKSSRIEKLQGELTARSSRIKELQDELPERDTRIKALQGESAARSSRIEELQDELASRDLGIEKIQSESIAKSSRIEKLQGELASRDSGIEKIQSESIAKSSRIEKLQGELTARSSRIKELQGELDSIKSSRWYSVVAALRKRRIKFWK